jgi:hypothetical protein
MPKRPTFRGHQNYLAAFGYRNETALNDPATSRGSSERPLPVGTRVASVNFGYGPREGSRDARERRPMDGWRTKGVKSRLQVSTVTDASHIRNYKSGEWASAGGLGQVTQYDRSNSRV